jgi:hypothetical protein
MQAFKEISYQNYIVKYITILVTKIQSEESTRD